MKKVFFILLTVTAFVFASCSIGDDIRGSVWVMKCENGRLEVEDTGSYDSYNDTIKYKITAFPDEGYCLKKDNLFVNEFKDNNYASYGRYSVTKESENIFTVRIEYDESVIVTAYFTKKESN